MTRSGRSVRDHDWCVWIYEAGVILMVIRLNLICTYSKNRLIEVLIVIAYPFFFSFLFSSVTYKLYLRLYGFTQISPEARIKPENGGIKPYTSRRP